MRRSRDGLYLATQRWWPLLEKVCEGLEARSCQSEIKRDESGALLPRLPEVDPAASEKEGAAR